MERYHPSSWPAGQCSQALVMGKGAPVPMLVIFIGAIGGMIMSGFIGLFTGAIILSLGYKLASIWLQGNKQDNKVKLN